MSSPQNQTVPGVPGPSATLNFSDPSTWVAIATAVGGVGAVAAPLPSIVQAVALLVAGIVAAAVLFSKHQLAAGVAAAAALVPQAVAVEQAVVGAPAAPVFMAPPAAPVLAVPPLPVPGVIPPLP